MMNHFEVWPSRNPGAGRMLVVMDREAYHWYWGFYRLIKWLE